MEELVRQKSEPRNRSEQEISGYRENQNTYAPFVEYYLGVLLKAYREFEHRIEYLTTKKMTKPERLKAVIDRHLGKITKKELMQQCPDISRATVERTLTELVKNGYLQKIGNGPATAYAKRR